MNTQARPFSRPVCSVMEDFLSERRLGRIHGRRKRMDVDGQAAVGDQLTTDGGICFRSPTRGNGGLEALQPNAPLGRGASSPMDADLAPPCNPYNLPFIWLLRFERGNRCDNLSQLLKSVSSVFTVSFIRVWGVKYPDFRAKPSAFFSEA